MVAGGRLAAGATFSKAPLNRWFLKTFAQKLKHSKGKHTSLGCTRINHFFEDESRFRRLTVLRRMIKTRGVKPTARFLHRFDNLYLFGTFSPLTGEECLLEMPCCNCYHFQVFLNYLSGQEPQKFIILIPDNGAVHHAGKLMVPSNMAFAFMPQYSSALTPAEKMCRYFNDYISMIVNKTIEALQQ